MSNDIEIAIKSTGSGAAPAFDKTEKSAKKLKDTLRDVGKTAAGVLTANLVQEAGRKFGEFVSDSVKAASDLNESLNAVKVTFGANAKEVTDWGKNNAANFGLSQAQFNAYATPLGAMLKNAGMSMQDTSKWTIDLTKRSADMASVFNTDVGEALEAIQAGLRGEADPLEKFGVGLSAAKVEAEALTETGKKSAASLTDQEKATARLNIIMKQTASVQGDFANTSDGAANAARKASAQFENAKASLGNALLPFLAKAAQAAGALAEGFNALPGPLQGTAVLVGTAGAAFVLFAGRIRKAKEELSQMGVKSLSADTRLGSMARTVGKVAGALGAMATASAVLSSDAGAKGVDTTRKALEEMRKSGEDATGTLVHMDYDLKNINQSGRGAGESIETFTGFIAEGLGRGWEKISAVNERMQALDSTLAGMVSSGDAKEAADDFDLLRRKAEEQGTSVEKLKEFFPQYQNALDAAARQSTDTKGSVQDLTKAMEEQQKQAEEAANAALGLRGAQRDLEAAYDDATKTIKKNGENLDIGSEKGRENQDVLDGIASKAAAVAAGMREAGASESDVAAAMQDAKKHFLAAADAAGMEAGEAQKLANKLFAIPKNVTTTINATDNASRVINNITQRLATINGKQAWVTVTTLNRNVIEGRAHGGVVGVGHAAGGGPRGGLIWAGEHGPELIDAAPGSTVHTASDSRRMMAEANTGGDMRVVLEVTSSGSPIDDFVTEIIRRVVRIRGGGDVQQALGGSR